MLGAILLACGPIHSTAAELRSPSQAAVNAAIAAPYIRYHRTVTGDVLTHAADSAGASTTLAVAAFAGNTRADTRLLGQIRHTLTAGNEPIANGGESALHERQVTAMFVIAKHTPRIWDQLTLAEKSKISLIMKATFVASAFTTSDHNPFVIAGSPPHSLDGAPTPDCPEGMVGGILAGVAYFGTTAASDILTGYDHSRFVAELDSGGLPNACATFNWKKENPASGAPTASQIESAVRRYLRSGRPLSDLPGIYQDILTHTYGRNVSTDMLKAFDDHRTHLANVLSLVVSGLWPKDGALETHAAALLEAGYTDLCKLAETVDLSDADGASRTHGGFGTTHGHLYNRSLWEDVLKPYLADSVPPPNPEFSAGSRIRSSASAKVHVSPSPTTVLTGLMPAGSLGTLLENQTTGNIHWWRVIFDNSVIGWINQADFSAAPTAESLTTTAGGPWLNLAIPSQSAPFIISFNMTPGNRNIEALTGLSTTAASGHSDLALALRFNTSGSIDALNGDSYQAANTLIYQPGVVYRVRLTVDPAHHTYSATATPAGSPPVNIATGYAFHNGLSSASTFANLAAVALTGSHTTSGVKLGPDSTRPSAPAGPKATAN